MNRGQLVDPQHGFCLEASGLFQSEPLLRAQDIFPDDDNRAARLVSTELWKTLWESLVWPLLTIVNKIT